LGGPETLFIVERAPFSKALEATPGSLLRTQSAHQAAPSQQAMNEAAFAIGMELWGNFSSLARQQVWNPVKQSAGSKRRATFGNGAATALSAASGKPPHE